MYSKIGILKKNLFKKVTRSDLVAGYLGQTAIKTKNVIKECVGGVLFIDEAYSLAAPDHHDSFSKECIDTLCEALSDCKDDITPQLKKQVIILRILTDFLMIGF